jgi:hypothetical protein
VSSVFGSGAAPGGFITRRGAAQIGRPSRASLFCAADSGDYAEEPCGCPICQAAAHRCDDAGENDTAVGLDDGVHVASD